MLLKNVRSLLEQLKVCIFAEIVFGVRCTLRQDVLQQPEANTDLLYFSALSYYKSSVETNFPISTIAFSH